MRASGRAARRDGTVSICEPRLKQVSPGRDRDACTRSPIYVHAHTRAKVDPPTGRHTLIQKPVVSFSLARSFTYSLSSLVSILSSLCVLLIYRAAGKCLRHSPSIVQPISLLFFLLLHLRVSSCHFLFPSPVRSPCERFAPFSAAPLSRFPHSLLRPEYID